MCPSEKLCRGCGQTLSIEEFYVHPQMKDGHLNYCKACVRARINQFRVEHFEEMRDYDRERAKRPERIARAKLLTARCSERMGYRKVHSVVNNAKRDGKIAPPSTCGYCGRETRLVAHHESYDQPLNVVWLCQACHVRLHHAKRKLEILAGVD